MIIIFTQCFPPRIGGIENLVFNISKYLALNSKKIYVLADDSKGSLDEEVKFPIKYFSGIKFLRKKKKSFFLKKLAKENDIKAIITDSWKSLEYLPNNLLDKNIICLAHGAEFPQNPSQDKKIRIKNSLAKAKHIIVNSQYTSSLCKSYVNANKIQLIRPGFTLPARIELRKKSKPILITISRLEERKGIDLVIETIPQLLKKHPNLTYKIAGDGPDRDRIESLIKDNKLEKQVECLGYIDQKTKVELYQQAKIFVMPSRIVGNSVEGFGIVYVEAAAYGVPTIGSNKGGASDAIAANKTGLLCSGTDKNELFDKIDKLLSDERLYKEFSNNSLTHSKQYSWENIIKEYIKIIE